MTQKGLSATTGWFIAIFIFTGRHCIDLNITSVGQWRGELVILYLGNKRVAIPNEPLPGEARFPVNLHTYVDSSLVQGKVSITALHLHES